MPCFRRWRCQSAACWAAPSATGSRNGVVLEWDAAAWRHSASLWPGYSSPSAPRLTALVWLAWCSRAERALFICRRVRSGPSAQTSPGKSSGSVSGFMNMGAQVGGAVTASLTPAIAVRFGWTASFLVAATLCLLGAAAWLVVDPDADPDFAEPGESRRAGKSLRRVRECDDEEDSYCGRRSKNIAERFDSFALSGLR